MEKNMNLMSSPLLLNKHKEIRLWPSCTHPKTLSFRATTDDSVFISPNESLAEADVELRMPGSYFTNSSEYFDNNECSSKEIIVRGLRSERLLFKPDPTSSILEFQGSGSKCSPVDIGSHDGVVLPYKESVAPMVMESENPYADFKKSMEEIVESHDFRDRDSLNELLGWYLRTNGENNHEFIVGAFIDLLAGISAGGGASCSDHSIASFTSADPTFPSSISSPLYQVGPEKIIEEGNMVPTMAKGTYEERLTVIEATIRRLKTNQTKIMDDMVQIRKEISSSLAQIRHEMNFMRDLVPRVANNYEHIFVDKSIDDDKKHIIDEVEYAQTVWPNEEDQEQEGINVELSEDVDKKVFGMHDGQSEKEENNKVGDVTYEDTNKKKVGSIVDKGPMYKTPKNVDQNKHKKHPRAHLKSSFSDIPWNPRKPLPPPHFKIDALTSKEIFALYDKRDEEALSFTYRGEYVGYALGLDFWMRIFCQNDPIEECGWLETSHIDTWSLLLLDLKLPDERWTIMPVHFMAFFDKKSLIPFANGSKPPYVDWANVDLILFPIKCNNGHWCIGGLDLRTWTLTLYYNSISEVRNEDILENLLAFKENFDDFLKSIDYWTKIGREPTLIKLNIQFAKGVPQQVNGSDSGVFVCMWLENLSCGTELKIKNNDVATVCMEYRRRMAQIIWARRD